MDEKQQQNPKKQMDRHTLKTGGAKNPWKKIGATIHTYTHAYQKLPQ
jgi:hypothetical protein